jgi:hypothetical protein
MQSCKVHIPALVCKCPKMDAISRYSSKNVKYFLLFKNAIVCDVMPFSLVEIYRSFGRSDCLHLHG